MAEASDFKFSTQLGFAKAHYKITLWGKSKGGLGLLELPYDTFAAAGARDLKFSTQLEFSKAHHKTTPREKGGVAFG